MADPLQGLDGLPFDLPPRPYGKECPIGDCGGPVKSRGMCHKHYQAWRVHALKQGVFVPTPQVKAGGPCGVEECPNPSTQRGLCRAHYQRARRHNGDPRGGRKGRTNPPKVQPTPHTRVVWLIPDARRTSIASAFDMAAETIVQKLSDRHLRIKPGAEPKYAIVAGATPAHTPWVMVATVETEAIERREYHRR